MTYIFTNNASSFLMASITSTDTEIIIDGAHANSFPDPAAGEIAMVTIEDRATAQLEVCEIIARNDAVLTISRAKEGTLAQNFTVGAIVSHRPTAGVMAYLTSGIGDFNTRYLGASDVPPTLDRDGGTVQVGALYFDTTDNLMYVHSSTGWIPFSGASYDGGGGGASFPPGGSEGMVLTLDSSLDNVWAYPVDTTARTSAGNASTSASARVLKAGDTMVGPLVIDSGVAGQTLLDVDGIILAREQVQIGAAAHGFKLVAGGVGTSDDKIQFLLNSGIVAHVTTAGWEFFTGSAVAAKMSNSAGAATEALIEYAATSTTVSPKAGARDDDFVVIVKAGAKFRVEDAGGATILDTSVGGAYISATQTFTASSTLTLAHSLGREPTAVRVRGRVKSGQSDAGYAQSDGWLDIPSGAANGSNGFQTYSDSTNVHIAVGADGPRVITKTFTDTLLDWTKWDFVVSAD